jgi:nucleotide-binding universal stress UspA family protein
MSVIVVGFDGSPASHVALARGIRRAYPEGRLYLVHAWDMPHAWRGPLAYRAFVESALADAEEIVEQARREHPGLEGMEWEAELIGGPAAKAIADVAAAREADEIIIGSRGFGRMRALLGSVSHEVIHLAACPVTVIPERLAAAHAASPAARATAT